MHKKWYFDESKKEKTSKDEIESANKRINKWKNILDRSKTNFEFEFQYFKKYALIEIDHEIEHKIKYEYSKPPKTDQIFSLYRIKQVIENLKEL